MEFKLSEEQKMLKDSARSFLDERATSAVVRADFDSEDGFSRETWKAIAQNLGWLGLSVPESLGGLGLGNVELTVIQQELGRALLPSPFFGVVCLAIPAILGAAGDAQKAALIEPLISGEKIAALAFTGPSGKPTAEDIAVSLKEEGNDVVLDGEAIHVLFGHVAEQFIVAAKDAQGGVSLIDIQRGTLGLTVEKLKVADPMRPYCRLRLTKVRVGKDSVLGKIGAAGPALARTLDLGAVALAAELVGGMERCIEMAVEHAKTRIQFNRLIGSFQALKHLMADMATSMESSKSSSFYAACVADDQGGELAEVASVTKSYCSEAFQQVSGDTIQVHGGMGFTWEHDAHFYFKHARSTMAFLGDTHYHRERLVQYFDSI